MHKMMDAKISRRSFVEKVGKTGALSMMPLLIPHEFSHQPTTSSKDGIVRIGIIGAENSHTRGFGKIFNIDKKFPGVEVKYVWGETEAFAKDAMKRGGIPNMVKHPKEMLDKIDALIVDHRHGKFHLNAAIPFIKRGIPTFIDKPFCYRRKKGEEFIAANGGKGGLGNTRFKSSTNRAPRKFTKGTVGEDFIIWLQLKTIADIGIIGLPNAGKSSLLAALTNANPKIANYRFTTLNPNLGVASYDDKEITIADIPGLVEGAHEGVGLGIQFLKHIERCKSLLHLIDITNIDLNESYDQVKNELKSYSSKLLDKKELIVLNKIDLIDEDTAKEVIDHFSKNKKCEILTMTTLEKSSISKIKAKLLSYVS